MRWPVESLSDGSNDNSISGTSTFLKLNPLEPAINQSIIFVDIWIVPSFRSTSDGIWNYSFEATLNGVGEWSTCWAHIATIQAGGVLAGDLITVPSIPLRCDTLVTVELDEEPQFTWWLNRTVFSGNPDEPSEQHVSIKMDRGEFVVYPMDINIVNLETWIPIVFWLVLLGLAFWYGWTWTAAFSIPGLMFALFPDQVPGGFEQYLLLAVLGLALEYFTGRRQKDSEELEV